MRCAGAWSLEGLHFLLSPSRHSFLELILSRLIELITRLFLKTRPLSRVGLLYVASSLVDTFARRVRSCPLVAGLVGVGGPAVA